MYKQAYETCIPGLAVFREGKVSVVQVIYLSLMRRFQLWAGF